MSQDGFLRNTLEKFRPRLKPILIVIGAQKAGTSALSAMLRKHPGILGTTRSELDFFSVDEEYRKGRTYYLQQFPAVPIRSRHYSTFEKSPSYMYQSSKAAPRIKEMLPGVTCLAILRDPVKRAYSAWNMYRVFRDHKQFHHLHDPRSFAQAVEDELAGKTERHYHRYLERGSYADQLLPFQAHFPKDQFLIRSYLDLKRNPGDFVDALCAHLRLPPMPKDIDLGAIKANKRPYTAPLDPGLAAELYRYFSPEMEKLDRVLGYHLDILEGHG